MPATVRGDVQIGFVEAQGLDEVGIVGEDRADLARNLPVNVEARLDEDQLGAFPFGGNRRHRRSDAERARLVARGGHHSAMPATDSDRLPLQLRIIALFDRRVEGVHVDMDDLADRLVGVGHD